MATDLGALAKQVFCAILVPARWLMETLGLHPVDMQVWALMVAVFMLAIAAPGSYGDWVLSRRQHRVTGTVLSIDTSGDSDTARIAFRDSTGRTHAFDSMLPINAATSTVGNPVDVIYDPLFPRRAREAGRWLAKGLTTIGWYSVAVLIFAYAIWDQALPTG
jgi:hypothetical protein